MSVFNLPTFTEDDLTAGPGVMFLGASGATPTVDVGAISEDGGVGLVIRNEKGELFQGNAGMRVFQWNKKQDFRLKVTGLEYNWTSLSYALGAGDTSSDATSETYDFGGDAVPSTVAIHVRHQMLGGDTMNVYAWSCYSGMDEIEVSMVQDLHEFPYEFAVKVSSTTWGGTSLSGNNRLLRLYRQT